MTAKENAQIGLSQLEDAIIEVLYRAKNRSSQMKLANL